MRLISGKQYWDATNFRVYLIDDTTTLDASMGDMMVVDIPEYWVAEYYNNPKHYTDIPRCV